MKTFILLVFAVILFGCSQPGNHSAFEGEVIPPQAAPAGTLSQESIYQLTDTFQTQDHQNITLSSFAGKPTVIGMIFTHCPYACPRLTADMKNIQEKLKIKNGAVNFLLVSFDTERDFPDQLKKYARSEDLDGNWTLLHGSENAVRTLSVLLNVQFQKDTRGNFSHSNMISVLDKSGVLVFQKEGLEDDPSETVGAISQVLQSKP